MQSHQNRADRPPSRAGHPDSYLRVDLPGRPPQCHSNYYRRLAPQDFLLPPWVSGVQTPTDLPTSHHLTVQDFLCRILGGTALHPFDPHRKVWLGCRFRADTQMNTLNYRLKPRFLRTNFKLSSNPWRNSLPVSKHSVSDTFWIETVHYLGRDGPKLHLRMLDTMQWKHRPAYVYSLRSSTPWRRAWCWCLHRRALH